MGNIIGEGFNEAIIQQIDARHIVFGALNREKYLKFLNGRAPWIKLSSSVNVTNDAKLSGTGLSNITLRDNQLAQAYVLFGGTAKDSGAGIRGGIDIWNGTDPSFTAYTVGDLKQGYRPMPGITSMESKNRNRGSIRETNIQLKAYNTTQFNIIDLLYLRLGYTVLLEWGHSVYIDNSGTVKEFSNSDTLTSAFVNGTYTDQAKLLEDISLKKKAFVGNYDALFGKITNFSWSYEADGSYTINLKILSLGDIIESLKMNTMPVDDKIPGIEAKSEESEDIESADDDTEKIDAYKNKDKISYTFWNSKYVLDNNLGQTIGEGDQAVTALTDEFAIALGFTKGIDFIKFEEYSGWFTSDDRYYVRLGAFLEYIKNNLLVYNNGKPLFDIDNDEESNIIFTTPYVLSSDPRVCIVKTTISGKDGGEESSIFPNLADFKLKISEKSTVGKLMNVYMSASWILKTMDSVRDKENKVSFYELMEKICDGISVSLGNVNKLSPVVDEENNNRFYIVDETSLPDKNEVLNKYSLSNKLAIFNVYGFKKDDASFITDLNIKTEISNDLSNMITIGAQANGNAVGEDATAFSNWNKGLVDRVIPQKSSDKNKTTDESTSGDINTKYENIVKEYYDFVDKMVTQKFDDQIDYFGSVLTNYLKYIQAKDSADAQKAGENTSSTTVGFIPINLGLTMVGLSGIKIYQKFSISQQFLPYNYPETIEFLTKGITQKVDDKGWTTTLESLSVPSTGTPGANPTTNKPARAFTSTNAGSNQGTAPTNTTLRSSAGAVGSFAPNHGMNFDLDGGVFIPYNSSGAALIDSGKLKQFNACSAKSTSLKVDGYGIAGGFRRTKGFSPNPGAPHGALDISTPKGTPLRFDFPNTTLWARLPQGRSGGYGNLVILYNKEKDLWFYFAHLNGYSVKVKNSKTGDATTSISLGATGDTDAPGAPHLHFEVRSRRGIICPNDYTQYINFN